MDKLILPNNDVEHKMSVKTSISSCTSCTSCTGGSCSCRKDNRYFEPKAIKNLATSQRHPVQQVQQVTQISLEESAKGGLDYILKHSKGELWPRTVSTKATDAKQTIVYSKEEALSYFKTANYCDCRISAYPYWRSSVVSKFVGIKNLLAPDLVMIDLDSCNFHSGYNELKASLQKTLRKVKQQLNLRPTVIWSGNGFHVYIPINAVVLEDIKEFAHIDQISTKFLRFAEWYISSGLSDSAHNSTVSLNNCMLRIPGSLNSKNNAQVSLIKKWDGNRPNINLLIGTFCAYLRNQEMRELKMCNGPLRVVTATCSGTIQWIERLLQTPIHDHRKFAIWRILAPYLINVKGLSAEQASSIIEEWLNRCNQVNRLNFYPKSKIREGVRGAAKRYCPISCEKLKVENSELYQKLAQE